MMPEHETLDVRVEVARSARRLLERAQQFRTSPDEPLDVLHVMRQVLQDLMQRSEREAFLSESPPIVSLVKSGKIGELAGALRWAQEEHPDDSTTQEGFTPRLRASLIRARNAHPGNLITYAGLVWAMLSDGNPVSEIFGRLEPKTRAAILSDLEQQFRSAAVLPQPIPVDPSYANRHQELIGAILQRLNSCEPPNIIVVSGENGQPLHNVIGKILAYEFARGIDMKGRLSSYETVQLLNLGSLLVLPVAEQAEALQKALRQSVEEHAVLLLEQMQWLDRCRPEQIHPHVRVHLANPGRALVLGLYDEAEEDNHPPIVRPLEVLPNVKWVQIQPYNEVRTVSMLRDYYFEQWRARGFTWQDGAFHLIWALAPGAWRDKKHKTVPYLAVDVAEELLWRIEERLKAAGLTQAHPDADRVVGALVHDIALTAHDSVTKLLEQHADQAVKRVFQPLLEQAKVELESLTAAGSQGIHRHNGLWELTSAHLIAQLLEGLDSSFRFPEYLRQAR